MMKVKKSYHMAQYIPLLVINSRELKMCVYTKTCTHDRSSIIHNSQRVEATHKSVVYPCSRTLFGHKKE